MTLYVYFDSQRKEVNYLLMKARKVNDIVYQTNNAVTTATMPDCLYDRDINVKLPKVSVKQQLVAQETLRYILDNSHGMKPDVFKLLMDYLYV